MLVLTMRENDKIDIGDDITICCVRMNSKSNQVKIGFEAPKEIQIVRHNAIRKDKKGRE